MRKKLAYVMLCTLCAAAGFGQSAVFTEPKAGTTLVMGSAQLIAWNSSGGASVKLVLVSKSDGTQWIIKSGIAISAGSWAWTVGALESGKTAPAGTSYLVRMQKMADDTILAKSGLFSIVAALAPVAEAKGRMNRPAETFSALHPQAKEMLLTMIPPPAGTPFTIKKIDYNFIMDGKVGTVIMTISTNSPAGFYISPNYGDPEYGAQWIDYVIENPQYEGFVCAGKQSYSGRVSVKGGGGSGKLNHPWSPVPAGPCDYFISFYPDYDGLAKGIGLAQKMASLPLQPGNLCLREFYPKLKVYLSAHTAAGTVKSSSTVYLVYNSKAWPLCWLSLPGETNSCAKGIQNW